MKNAQATSRSDEIRALKEIIARQQKQLTEITTKFQETLEKKQKYFDEKIKNVEEKARNEKIDLMKKLNEATKEKDELQNKVRAMQARQIHSPVINKPAVQGRQSLDKKAMDEMKARMESKLRVEIENEMREKMKKEYEEKMQLEMEEARRNIENEMKKEMEENLKQRIEEEKKVLLTIYNEKINIYENDIKAKYEMEIIDLNDKNVRLNAMVKDYQEKEKVVPKSYNVDELLRKLKELQLKIVEKDKEIAELKENSDSSNKQSRESYEKMREYINKNSKLQDEIGELKLKMIQDEQERKKKKEEEKRRKEQEAKELAEIKEKEKKLNEEMEKKRKLEELKKKELEYKSTYEDNIHAAIRAGSLDNVKYLISNGADFEELEGDATPLCTAISCDRFEIAKYIISLGAEINPTRSFSVNSPLVEASLGSKFEMFKYLIDHGANVNSHNPWGETPLHWAANDNNKKVVEILLKKGANVNCASDTLKITPLMYAAEKGNKDIITLLLKSGADKTMKDKNGQTAYDHAKTDRTRELLK